MVNMNDFVEKVIGASIIVKYQDGDPDERDTFICVIKDIEEMDDGMYQVTTRVGFQFKVPELQTLIDILDGTPYYAVNTEHCKVIIKANK